MPRSEAAALQGFVLLWRAAYNEFLLRYTKPLFAYTAFIQERSGAVGGESSLLSPLFPHIIGLVKVIQIIKVCIQQLIRTDPNAD